MPLFAADAAFTSQAASLITQTSYFLLFASTAISPTTSSSGSSAISARMWILSFPVC